MKVYIICHNVSVVGYGGEWVGYWCSCDIKNLLESTDPQVKKSGELRNENFVNKLRNRCI